MSKTNANGGESCFAEDKFRVDFSPLRIQKADIPWRFGGHDKALRWLGRNDLYIPSESVQRGASGGIGKINSGSGPLRPGRDAFYPCVSLERGNYRMRGPNTRPLPPLFQGQVITTPRPMPRQKRQDRHLMFLLVLLALCCLTCFSIAYYLFSTRWAIRVENQSSFPANLNAQANVSEEPACTFNTSGKYLAYLPHSGFHNQRIAFENALLLAHALHRTLLVPPIRLGNKPIRYVEYDTLSQYIELSDKEGLKHCPQVPPYISRPAECLHYFESAYVPWTWLVDLSTPASRQTICHLPTMSRSWIAATFDISPSETYTLRDKSPYQFRFVDNDQGSLNRGKYLEDMHISQLGALTEKLVQIGTLFGTSRLYLENRDNLAYRKVIRQSMAFANQELSNVATSIAQAFERPYISLHLRSGDGLFQSKIAHTVNATWWRTLHDVIGLSIAEICHLEATVGSGPSSACTDDLSDLGTTPSSLYSSRTPNLGLKCRGNEYTVEQYMPLNIPLYVATDLPTPQTHPQLSIFRRTFPCMFFLGDFRPQLRPLQDLQSTYDSVNMYEFSLPFVDALVAGKALRIVGTDGSTFSKFVGDILWASDGGASH
ncbi:hypothetical protein HYPSUDRAFT_68331 [Hypholoma sublateritium FD-334 SS-4]|uniref:O-fucosyltransferase family protein n=1 Tax=Hypholoma sublateritium (strain FD-334 SS-4) TaxID=945553 RepID=A0A0D2MBI7_HYPSF|nr:hypothetical protein HYPSUDRAFT_68331 [Hypholoma sublateritium FD-334 SS-4]